MMPGSHPMRFAFFTERSAGGRKRIAPPARSSRALPRLECLEDRVLLSLSPSLVKDINQAGPGSAPALLTTVGSTVFFVADDIRHGTELWRSDGTAAGTVMVKNIG